MTADPSRKLWTGRVAVYFGNESFPADSGVTIQEVLATAAGGGSTSEVPVGDYVFFQDTDGSLKILAPDGSVTAAIVIKATCQDTTSAANDCVLQDFSVRWDN
jgi:hypothetical protein